MNMDEKELKRVLSNPDSLIMSEELEGLIDLDHEQKDNIGIDVNGDNFLAKIISMTRDAEGVSVALNIPDFPFNVFLTNKSAIFNIDEEVYSSELTSISKDSGNTILSIFIAAI